MRVLAIALVVFGSGCAPPDDGPEVTSGRDDPRTDADRDGFESTVAGGDDCNDADPTIFPGAEEIWYDGVDQDCAGDDDFDQDRDGFALGPDCDDVNPDIYPGVPEIWYDGIDQDCAGDDDFDQDGDGVTLELDCDDTDPSIGIGRVLDVPGDHATIQAAIEAACDFSTVRVAAGTWNEALQIDLPLTLIGAGSATTVLDGPSGSVVTATAPLTMTGFTVRGGFTFGDGGGLDLVGGTLSELVVTDNVAFADGGGIFSTGALELVAVEISDNRAFRGGGIFADELDLVSVQVLDNSSTSAGGGVSGIDVTLTDTVISGNASTSGDSGAIVDRGTGFVAVRTVFEGNTSAQDGAVTLTPADLTDCVVVDNRGPGGAFTGDVTARGTSFVRNANSAVRLVTGGNVRLENSLVLLDEGNPGPAVNASTTGTLELANVTMVGNAGVGVLTRSADVMVTNTIVAFHGTGGIEDDPPRRTDVDHTAFFGNAADAIGFASPVGTDGNLGVDPRFVRYAPFLPWTDWDLHLHPDSLLIDAGDPSLVDPDGSPSDIGAFGGPSADFQYYQDIDGDGMYDGWEGSVGLDPTVDDAADDGDGDGLPNREEFDAGTFPDRVDSDGDAVSDGEEVSVGSDPLDPTDRPIDVVIAIDITNSWTLADFLEARDAALLLFDSLTAEPSTSVRVGCVVFYGRYGVRYTPLVTSAEALALGLRDDWELLRPANINASCPFGEKCAPWMPWEYPDETGTDHSTGLQGAAAMFAKSNGFDPYRAVILLTDGEPANVGAHQIRFEEGDVEQRWPYEYAPLSRTVAEIEIETVAVAQDLFTQFGANVWVVAFDQDAQFLRDTTRGDGYFVREEDAEDLSGAIQAIVDTWTF